MAPVRVEVQRESIDTILRNRLWNALEITLWRQIEGEGALRDYPYGVAIVRIWLDFFKRPLDELPEYWDRTKPQIRAWFFEARWYEVYDFVESVLQFMPRSDSRGTLVQAANRYLEEELSAYRIVGDHVAEITRTDEIAAIEAALEDATPFAAVHTHLRDGLAKLSDRASPDYRNSIKESISSVEAMCRIITGEAKATLGSALKRLEDAGVRLHPAIKTAWSNLYGYTSDEGGVRHALTDEPDVTFADAKYMLVSCSAFVSYLLERSRQASIPL